MFPFIVVALLSQQVTDHLGRDFIPTHHHVERLWSGRQATGSHFEQVWVKRPHQSDPQQRLNAGVLLQIDQVSLLKTIHKLGHFHFDGFAQRVQSFHPGLGQPVPLHAGVGQLPRAVRVQHPRQLQGRRIHPGVKMRHAPYYTAGDVGHFCRRMHERRSNSKGQFVQRQRGRHRHRFSGYPQPNAIEDHL